MHELGKTKNLGWIWILMMKYWVAGTFNPVFSSKILDNVYIKNVANKKKSKNGVQV